MDFRLTFPSRISNLVRTAHMFARACNRNRTAPDATHRTESHPTRYNKISTQYSRWFLFDRVMFTCLTHWRFFDCATNIPSILSSEVCFEFFKKCQQLHNSASLKLRTCKITYFQTFSELTRKQRVHSRANAWEKENGLKRKFSP